MNILIEKNVMASDYYEAPWRHTGGVFELGISLFWSLFMVPEELQRQLRQGKASMEQMGMLMQVMGNASAQFERLPLVDMPLLRDSLPTISIGWPTPTTMITGAA